MGVGGTHGALHWAVVLEMPDHADLRLTVAETQYNRLMSKLDRRDYLDDIGYAIAIQDLRTAYDQACRELGNPG
jgi:hypothetical protein